ncbi:armadillo-type protein [Bisporella sp. PMI_857]|nr:armadillo-type protein [Bisporella sp. PMI_857]
MVKSIQEIFELEESARSGELDGEGDEEMGDDDEEEVDLEDRERRTGKLKGLLGMLAQLWWADSEHMDMAAEKLADGSRDPKWRVPLGDSGVLNFFLEILGAHTLRYNLKVHLLRLIGNSCADTDENRARVVAANSLPAIISQLKDTSLIPFAIPVLYNICLDYEPAQLQASNAFLSKELVELISNPRFNDNRSFLGYSCKLLELLLPQPSEIDLAPENIAVVLLKITADKVFPVDLEDFISTINTAVQYLQHEKFQKPLISQGALDLTLAVMVDSYTRDAQASILSDEDDAKKLTEMRSKLNSALSDISALPEFRDAVPISSPLCGMLRRWLSSPQLQLQICACFILGNLARSDDACIELVHISKAHMPLIAILASSKDSQLLHAALSFLKNLALPLKNKLVIGEADIFDHLPRLWLLDTLQQIQFDSISLSRQLLIGTFSNIRKITKRLSYDLDSPANMRSKLSLLIALFQRTDVDPIRMEISRLITAICRCYNTHTADSAQEYERVRKNFFEVHPDVSMPLGFMVSQTKWPVVRSEGWFVFALMARYPESARCISDMMQDVAVFQPLVELLTGKNLVGDEVNSYSTPTATISTTPSSSGGMADSQTPESIPYATDEKMRRIDRENALVLVNELLKTRGSEMAIMRRTMFEDLLKGGSDMVASWREAEWGDTQVPKERRARGGHIMQDVIEQSFNELL